MPLDYDLIKNWQFPEIRQDYDEKDCMLYALGLGFGTDPMDESQLRFVYEKQLLAFPTMSSILCHPGFWMKEQNTGIDWVRLVHGEQRTVIHAPLPVKGSLTGRLRISHVIDKGSDKGALVITEKTLYDASQTLLATIQQTTFCRGDGGLDRSDDPPAALPAVPAGEPQQRFELAIPLNAAILYRLNADPNPLHIDPGTARAAGFERPILHGLCTYGMAARAIVQHCCEGDPTRLRRFDARFSAPVFPGETLVCEIWRPSPGLVQFQARVRERDKIVLSHGVAEV